MLPAGFVARILLVFIAAALQFLLRGSTTILLFLLATTMLLVLRFATATSILFVLTI